MTLVFVESFDNFEDNAWLDDRFDSRAGNAATVSGRHGGRAMASSSGSGMTLGRNVPLDDEYTVGWRVRGLSDFASGGNAAITFRLAAVDQFTLRLVDVTPTEWRIELRRGGLAGTVVATQTQAQHNGAWHYIEIKVLADPTAGTYEVRLDGVQLAELTATGQDTTGAGSANIDNFVFAIHNTSEHDDIYILNNATGTNNTFLGPIYVEGLRPDGDGNQTDWTPSAGMDNFAMVDEPGTGTQGTDYNETATSLDVDLYTYANLQRIGGASVSIPGVQLVSLMALSAAGSEDFKHTFRSGGMEHDAGNQSVTSTAQTDFDDLFETNLAESEAWNVADLNAIEFGVEKV